MSLPLVSIIIPSYRRPLGTQRAVQSALLQTYKNVEVLVIDDNGARSTQQLRTEEMLVELGAAKHLKYIVHDVNRGGNAARNTGVANSRGKYVTFLDSDDVFLPAKIELQVKFLESESDSSLVKAVTCNRLTLVDGEVISESKVGGIGKFTSDILLFRKNLAAGSTIMIEKHALTEIGEFDIELARHQELEFLVRYFERYELAVLPEVLVEVHTDDRGNIPRPKAFIENKRRFFQKIDFYLNKLSDEEKYEIFRLHNLEIAKVCLRHFDLLRAVKYICMSRPTFSELRDLVVQGCRILSRKVNASHNL